jgi:hypothetical protein
LSLKHLFALGFFIICVLLGAAISAEEINLYFKTSPLLERLRPFSETATISLLATGADGKPLTRGWATVRLEAPRSGGFFSTDFPLVEGTELAEMRLPLKAGKVEWKYVFPIRGEYRLIVDVLTVDGNKASKTFEFKIHEHGTKWLVLGVFTLGLFAVGFVAGRIFTSLAPASRGPTGMILLFVVTSFTFLVGSAIGQEAGNGKPVARLEIDPPTVGKPARVHWRLEGDRATATQRAVLSLTIVHLEKEKTVFAIDRIPVEGEYSMNFQFTDGAEYRVTARAILPGGQSARAEQVVEVAGVEPPVSAMMPAIGVFLTVIAVGLGAGRWSRCHATPS